MNNTYVVSGRQPRTEQNNAALNSLVNFSGGFYIKEIEEPDANTLYVGFAVPGSATSSPVWFIMKMVISGTRTYTRLADGNTNFDNVWDNRASLPYS